MEPDNIFDDVIIRYLLNEANAEEVKFIREWMNADEKNKLHVESLQNILQLIHLKQEASKIDVEQEWNHFRQEEFENHSSLASLYIDKSSDWESHNEEKHHKRKRVYKILIATTIAASLIFAIGRISGWFSSPVQHEAVIAQKNNLPEDKVKVDPLWAVVHHEVNASGKTKQVTLPDGSVIALADSSELTYKEPANGNRREVYLMGKADFKVAKNKSKPFTVYSEDISTTAIGTRFTVTANTNDNLIRVRLHEGKVVVKHLKDPGSQWTKDIYLMPGQELVYNKVLNEVSVTWFVGESRTFDQITSQTKDSPSIPRYNKGSWFMFNNQPLSEVLDALSEMYDAKIIYAKNAVKNKYFIGTYDKSDSLEKILKQIALLNNLQMIKQNDTFRIEKPKVKK